MSGHVLSVTQRAERELPRGADESTRELLDATQDAYRGVSEQLDGVLNVPLRAVNTVNIVLFGRTGRSLRDLEERAHHAVTIADIGLLCFDTRNQQDGEFPFATTEKTRGSADWCSGHKGC